MDITVRQHLAELKSRVQLLTEKIMDNNRHQEERNQLKAELSAATLAIAHYEAALKQERKLASH
jgi:hypothetical protein